MARKPKPPTITPGGPAPNFAPIIDRIAELWASIPDDDPFFDVGRELLARMERESNGKPL